MNSKEDYIILTEVLRKMEFDVNYKATYTEEAVLSSMFEDQDNNLIEAIRLSTLSIKLNPTDQTF
jgi:hypothetical protein